jgi:ADP-ribosylglycohydrolase
MKGGGYWKLAPGQTTDDGETTLTLAYAIMKGGSVDQESIAKAYRGWCGSDPFDIGQTTRNSFSEKTTALMLKASQELDAASLVHYKDHAMSNGMLMRISPIGIVVAGYMMGKRVLGDADYQVIVEMVKKDTYLTHHSENALAYAVAYVVLLAHCIVHGNMVKGIQFLDQYHDKKAGDWEAILKNGLDDRAKLAHNPKEKIGDSRIAFQLAVRKADLVSRFNDHLGKSRIMDFSEAIVSTVKLGGDTDTNACIVGALCGAVTGFSEIPDPWTNSISSVECQRYLDYPINMYTKTLSSVATQLFTIGMKM